MSLPKTSPANAKQREKNHRVGGGKGVKNAIN
jgi:hypothetical protein